MTLLSFWLLSYEFYYIACSYLGTVVVSQTGSKLLVEMILHGETPIVISQTAMTED